MKDNSSLNNLRCESDKNSQANNSSDKSFFLQEGVNKLTTDTKDTGLKNRLRALILKKGMKEEHEFFQSLGMTRQYWFRISWGIQETPTYLKIKIAKALDVDSCVIWEMNNE